jgi:sulfonate transport system permease protein
VPLALIVLWQLASSLQLVTPETLPPPTVILAALKELIADGELQSAIGVSLVRAATGYSSAVALLAPLVAERINAQNGID